MIITEVRKNSYMDSLFLMRVNEEARKIQNVRECVIAMATDTNKALISRLGLMNKEIMDAKKEDLVIAVSASDQASRQEIISKIDMLLQGREERKSSVRYFSIESALSEFGKPDIAVVSLPGEKAVSVSMELISKGINVHLFSDNISVKDEIELKKAAIRKNVLLLGPGSGTSIINGIGICFSNAVSRGKIGIIGSSGTGIQELITILDNYGVGVSDVYGVGGNDMTDEVNGLMTKKCIEMLKKDRNTESIVIISKKPSERAMKSISRETFNAGKETVMCMIGMRKEGNVYGTIHSASNSILRKFKKKIELDGDELKKRARELCSGLDRGMKYIRGIYSGGSLAQEAAYILELLGIKANTNRELMDPFESIEDTIIDVGDEFFTKARAHPMIDPTLKKMRIKEEMSKDDVCVVMFDVILGYGVPDGIAEKTLEKSEGSKAVILAHVVGTKKDKQNLEDQVRYLEENGAVVCRTNAEMAVLASLIKQRCTNFNKLKENWGEIFG